MNKQKRELLTLMSGRSSGAYGVYGGHFIEDLTNKEIAERLGKAMHKPCFSTYTRGGKSESDNFYYPFHLRLDLSRKRAGIDAILAKDPAYLKAYNTYFYSLLEELNNYARIEYDSEYKLISVFPDKKAERLFVLTYLTKLRSLFEIPYSITAMSAEFFQDDFPELNLEEITYLLDVLVMLSGSGHGIFPCYNMTRFGKYQPFSEIIKNSKNSKKFYSINGDSGIIERLSVPSIFSSKYAYPGTPLLRYETLVSKKEYIIEKCINKEIYEKSIPS